jgi:hypothetical protein
MIHPPLKLVLRAPHGTITHIAGEDDEPDDSDDEGTFKDGPALTARFGGIISGVVATDGALFLSDENNHRIRKLQDGVVSTLVGTGEQGFQGSSSVVAQFYNCSGLGLDCQGRLVADCDNTRIRIVAMDGATTTLAGNGEGGHEDGPSQQRASFVQTPSSPHLTDSSTWQSSTRFARYQPMVS